MDEENSRLFKLLVMSTLERIDTITSSKTIITILGRKK